MKFVVVVVKFVNAIMVMKCVNVSKNCVTVIVKFIIVIMKFCKRDNKIRNRDREGCTIVVLKVVTVITNEQNVCNRDHRSCNR